MQATEHAASPNFRGSISRRLTVLSALFLVLVAIVGGLSVQKARHISGLNAEIEDISAEIEELDSLESAVFHLRGEAQDVLLLGHETGGRRLEDLVLQDRELWQSFKRRHAAPDYPVGNAGPAEAILYQELGESLQRYLDLVSSIAPARPLDTEALGRAAAELHAGAHRLEATVARTENLHRALIAERSRAARDDLRFIFWTYVAFVFLGSIAVAAGSFLFVQRMVLPLRRLNSAALDVAQGAYGRRVPVTSRDEIGMLAHTFNRMAEGLAERDAQVRRHAQEAEALHRVGTEVSSLLQIDRVITSVVESTRDLFAAEVAGLALADGPAQEIRWTVFVGGRDGAFKEVRLRAGEGVAGRVIATGAPLIVEDAAGELAERPQAYPVLEAEGLRAALAVPLRHGERTLGALMVAYGTPRRFTDDETTLLSSFANQVAVAVENAELYKQVQALHRVGMEISSLLDLDRVLKTVVESARSILRTDVSAICLLRDGGPQLDVPAVAGPWEDVMGARPEQCCDDPAAGCDICRRCHEAHRSRNVGHLSAPLKRGEDVLGALCVGTAAPRAFGEAEQVLLGGLAAQAAIAIENARLYDAVRGLAAVEERERLAREMHDGLAQALGFLNLKLSMAERGMNGEAPEGMQRALAEMRKVAGEAYDEVRQAIFGLRTMVSRGLGLVPTLTEYLHEFSQQTGVDVKLEVPEEDGPWRFVPEMEVQLIRIIQEALRNVWKHACARAARVRFRRDGEDVVVWIEDNGVGFDASAVPADGRRHFGLATMRERAEAVGGALNVQTAPGAGTHVLVRLPLAPRGRGGTA